MTTKDPRYNWVSTEQEEPDIDRFLDVSTNDGIVFIKDRKSTDDYHIQNVMITDSEIWVLMTSDKPGRLDIELFKNRNNSSLKT